MNHQELLDHCRHLAFSGKDYEFIRDELEQLPLSVEERIQLLAGADEYLAHYQLALQQKDRALQQMILGAVVFLFGFSIYVFTILSFQYKYILAWGAILYGAWVFKEAYKAYKIPLSNWASPLDQISRRIKR